MNCDGCGKPIGEADQYCPHCGRRRTQTDMPYAEPPAYPSQMYASQASAPPGYPPPMYPPAGAYYPAKTSGYAIASLVLALVGGCGIGSVLAIIFGNRAKREITHSNGQLTGEGMATAGVIIGWIGVAGLVLYVLFIVGVAFRGP
jgi:hypothetical protein